jgi:hypothetical protein
MNEPYVPLIKRVKGVLEAGGLRPEDYKHLSYKDLVALAKQYGLKENEKQGAESWR